MQLSAAVCTVTRTLALALVLEVTLLAAHHPADLSWKPLMLILPRPWLSFLFSLLN